ncbi:MAG: type II toxin-antitoxin system VapC family toxin [Verrucomicrobia bacterium]|nr:type II toxin-antitoxin system VapC family toxin [Leptolyngbya sp. ES-bin-22]
MSSILLDTHAFIWLAENDQKLPTSVRETIEATDNVFVSIVSFWEISIKLKKERIFLACDFNDIESRFESTGFQLLSISIKDTIQLYNLPFYLKEHKDPFDRLLIAQAISRSLPLASCDKCFNAYPIQRVWE